MLDVTESSDVIIFELDDIAGLSRLDEKLESMFTGIIVDIMVEAPVVSSFELK
jgi:hypothetical protein